MMNSMQSAGSLHYSTVGVTESRRFEYWNDVVYATVFQPPAPLWLGSTLMRG